MKVQCIKLIDSLGNSASTSAWLTVGNVYHVLSLLLDSGGRWLLRLVGDSEPGVGLFPLQQFEIVSAKVPDCWVVTWNGSGVFELTTEAWRQDGYWERYFEGETAAYRIFEREMARIVAADP